MLKKTALLLVLAIVCHAAPSESDLDALLSEVFGPTSSTDELSVSTEAANGGSKDDADSNKNVDKIIDDIFGPTSSTEKSISKDEDEIECVTNGGEKGKCVAYYRCEHAAEIIDIAGSDSMCLSYLDLCCLPKFIDVHPIDPTKRD